MTDQLAVLPRPEVAPPGAWAFPEADRHTLANGATLLTYHVPNQHVLSLRVGIPAPLSAEPAAIEGVSLIMARCIDEGTATHTAEELAELLERRGIALGAGVGERGLVVDLDVPSRHLGEALELLTECLTCATFPEREVNRHRRHRLADIEHDYADPGNRAALAFIDTYYDAADRASRPAGGTAESVRAITAEDVRAHHHRWIHPNRAVIVLAGDLGDEAAQQRLPRRIEEAMAAWSPVPELPSLESTSGGRAADAGRLVLVDRPGAVQTEVYVGGPGASRRDRFGWGTYQALSLALGGSPTALIDRVLREEKGYTYGIRASFRPRARGGVFSASGSVRADVTAPALQALLEVLNLPGSALSGTDLRAAADFVARTAPGRYATADALAAEAISLTLAGLDTDFVTDSVEQARTLTADHARAAWDSHRGEPWTVVLVGDAAAHAEAVAALGCGDLTVVEH